jgi:hypothetical protein
VTGSHSYGNPASFRQALTDKLRGLAVTSCWALPQLQRQLAYDRLLERLYLADDSWIVKGATALLARDIGVRATIDIDVYRPSGREAAEGELRRAAAVDIGDWFRFETGLPRPVAETGGVRLPVTAFVGNTAWASFHVDLISQGLRMTGEPEKVPPLARVAMPDVEQHGYRVYPLVDHVADKLCALFERHGVAQVPSTRYKDLIDLVAIVLARPATAGPQMAALQSEAARRGLHLPQYLTVPDRALWCQRRPNVNPAAAAENGPALPCD